MEGQDFICIVDECKQNLLGTMPKAPPTHFLHILFTSIICQYKPKVSLSDRFVIGQEAALTILDIDDGKYQEDSGQYSEEQLCTDTRSGDTSSELSDVSSEVSS
jgi:hypothetical protein